MGTVLGFLNKDITLQTMDAIEKPQTRNALNMEPGKHVLSNPDGYITRFRKFLSRNKACCENCGKKGYRNCCGM